MMKKIRFKNIKKMIAVILIGTFVIEPPLQSLGAEKTNTSVTQYVSEIKMVQGKDEKAQKKLEDLGYTVVKEDLNDGTGYDDVYIGYKTTTDREQALTDIAVMNMNGGYKTTNFNTQFQQNEARINVIASEMMSMCQELKQNYEKGSPAAKLAVTMLDNYYEDRNDNVELSTYLMSSRRTMSDYFQLVTMTNSVVLSSIYNALAMGVADYNEANWMERLSEIGSDKMLDDALYSDKASELVQAVETFRDKYFEAVKNQEANKKALSKIKSEDDYEEYMSDTFTDTGEIKDNDEAGGLYLVTYKKMQTYRYGDGTIADLFTKKNVRTEDLYPLAKALTTGQVGAMRMAGACILTATVVTSEEDNSSTFNDAIKQVQKANQKHIKSIVDNAKKKKEKNPVINNKYLSVWYGTNFDAYDGCVGITNEAYRKAAAENNYNQLAKDEDAVTDVIWNYMMGTIAVGLAAVTVACFTLWAPAVFTGTTIAAMASSLVANFGTTVASVLGAFVGLGPVAVIAVAVVVAVFLFVTWVVKKAIESYDYYHPKYTSIPVSMFDVRKDSFLTYKTVTDIDSKAGDLNAWEGQEWISLYTSKDKKAGSPILADSFKVQYGDGQIPDDSIPVHLFGKATAYNLNSNTRKDKKKGIYLFYVTEDSLGEKGDITVDNPTNSKGDTLYVSDLEVISGKTEDFVKQEFAGKTGKWKVVDLNLTAGSQYATYIGYKTTTKKESAITDLRTSPGEGEKEALYGAIKYGKCGTVTSDGTKKNYTLWCTKSSKAGYPILANIAAFNKIEDVSEKFVPVTGFGAGTPTDFEYKDNKPKNSHRYVYFQQEIQYVKSFVLLAGTSQTSVESLYNNKVEELEEEAKEDSTGGSAEELTLLGSNLTPDGDFYTTVAYTTTTNEDEALKDVRLTSESKKVVNIAGVNYKKTEVLSKKGCKPTVYLRTTTDRAAGEPIWDLLEVSDSQNEKTSGYESIKDSAGEVVSFSGKGNTFLNVYHGNAKYLDGLTYVESNVSGYVQKMAKQLNITLFDFQFANSDFDQSCRYKGYLGYGETNNPKRAIRKLKGHIADNSKEKGSSYLTTVNGIGYGAVSSYIASRGRYEEVGLGMYSDVMYDYIRNSNNIVSSIYDEDGYAKDIPRSLYVTAGIGNGAALTKDDIKIIDNNNTNKKKKGWLWVNELWNETSDSNKIDYSKRVEYSFWTSMSEVKGPDSRSFYIAYKGKTAGKKKYISSLKTLSTSKSDYARTALKNALASGGYMEYIDGSRLPEEGDDNYQLGIARTDDPNKAVRGIYFYINRQSEHAESYPDVVKKIDGIEYNLIGTTPAYHYKKYSARGVKKIHSNVWIYVTYNTAAGAPITDIQYKEGMTENNEQINVLVDADSYKDKYYNYIDFGEELRDELDSCISIGRDYEGKTRYVKSGSIVGYYGSFDDAKKYFRSVNVQSYASQDFNEASGDKAVYIGYNWTLRENEAVRDIRVSNDSSKRVSGYTKVNALNLNYDTNGKEIYLYYSTDAGVGKPITAIGGGSSVSAVAKETNVTWSVVKKFDNSPANMEEGVQRFRKAFWSWFGSGFWYDVDAIYMHMARKK